MRDAVRLPLAIPRAVTKGNSQGAPVTPGRVFAGVSVSNSLGGFLMSPPQQDMKKAPSISCLEPERSIELHHLYIVSQSGLTKSIRRAA